DRNSQVLVLRNKPLGNALVRSLPEPRQLVAQAGLSLPVRPRPRVDDDATRERSLRGFVADDEMIATECHQRCRQHDLAERGLFRPVATLRRQENQLGQSLCRSQMAPDALMAVN